MTDIIFLFGAGALFAGGWLMGAAYTYRAIGAAQPDAEAQEAEFKKVLDDLYVPPPPPLTDREQRIGRLHDAGLSADQIMQHLATTGDPDAIAWRDAEAAQQERAGVEPTRPW